MMTSRWSTQQQETLAQLVWSSIDAGLRGGDESAVRIPDELWLQRPAATFVTLQTNGKLRGCIGTLEASLPLGESVVRNARSAAFGDPRFEPVRRSELPALKAEISVLTPLKPLQVWNWDQLHDRLQAGHDGVVVRCLGHSATFLPAVWEDLPDPSEFLDQLWRKAGLQPRFWSDDVRIWTYQADKLLAPRPSAQTAQFLH